MWRDAVLVCAKDLRIELRARVLLWQVLPFGVLSLVLFALALGPSLVALRHGAPGMLWLALLLATVLAAGRSAQIESPEGTRASVRLLGLDPGGVFLGKALALFVELAVLTAVLAVGLLVGFHVDGVRLALAAPLCACAVVALAAVGTLYGAVVAGTDVAGTLLPLLVLPALAAGLWLFTVVATPTLVLGTHYPSPSGGHLVSEGEGHRFRPVAAGSPAR